MANEKMTNYMDGSGKSGIRAYEIDENGVTIMWKSGALYSYPKDQRFIDLLEGGEGANAYLNENLK